MTALLLIDMQNDYFPGGQMELVGGEAAGRQAGRLLSAFRAKGLPVIHIQHIADHPGATFFLPHTEGVNIHDSVLPLAGEKIITKHHPSAFRETGLLEHLQAGGITRLVMAGMMTHMCVDSTVRAAADLGFVCQLAHDACATRDLAFAGNSVTAADVQTAYLAALNDAFAEVLDTRTLCAALA